MYVQKQVLEQSNIKILPKQAVSQYKYWFILYVLDIKPLLLLV
tara:strand:+ start:285 stop:413 length:129 start_codon:yes stop_codon:yes gene_type:complete